MKKSMVKAFFLLLVLGFLSGCGDYVGKEKSHPLFVRAGSCRVAGNYKEAAQYFEEFLFVCPKSALAHYELASVYGDNLDDPFRAMFHYGKYLELAPDSADRDDVKKFEESCRKRIFEQLSREYESADTAKAYNETARLKSILAKYVEYSSKLKAQNDQMRKIISERKFIREVSVQPLRTSPVPGGTDPFEAGTPAVRTETPAASSPAPKTVRDDSSSASRVYTVKAGDTLSRISKNYYGTSKYYPEILNANRSVIGDRGVLQPGMKLTMPVVKGDKK